MFSFINIWKDFTVQKFRLYTNNVCIYTVLFTTV